jgi:hypothetical protein
MPGKNNIFDCEFMQSAKLSQFFLVVCSSLSPFPCFVCFLYLFFIPRASYGAYLFLLLQVYLSCLFLFPCFHIDMMLFSLFQFYLVLCVSIFVIVLFVFIFYATASVQFYAGPYMHSLCRSTPFPVNNSWVDGLDYSLYRCIPGVNFDTLADDPTMTKSSSPWAEPQTDCYWPLADSSILSFQTTSYRFCSFGKMYGSNFCPHDTSHIDESLWSWCGSNFDAYGNSRFGHSLDHDPDVYYYDLNWGFTNFDNFGKSLITIFQVITAEGWSYIMYFLMDSAGNSTAAAFFVSLML